MKNYVDAIALQEYTTKLVAKLKTLFPGTPTAAATVADMTDHSKTYVYVGTESGYTAGDWYYWDGSAWTSGGPFQATSIITDTTLEVAGEAADAKATGDAIAAAKTAVLNAMAPAYSPSETYAVGAYVNQNGAIYRCTTAITTAEAWTAGHWAVVTLGADLEGQVGDLKTQLTEYAKETVYDEVSLGTLALGEYQGGTIQPAAKVGACTQTLIPLSEDIHINIENGFACIVAQYMNNGAYTGTATKYTENVIISKDSQRSIQLCFRYADYPHVLSEDEQADLEGFVKDHFLVYTSSKSVVYSDDLADELDNYAPKTDLNSYAKKTDLTEYAKSRKVTELELGTLALGQYNTGSINPLAKTSACTQTLIPLSEDIYIEIEDGFKCIVFEFMNSGVYIGNYTAYTENVKIDKDLTHSVQLEFRYSDARLLSAEEQADLDGFVNAHFKVYDDVSEVVYTDDMNETIEEALEDYSKNDFTVPDYWKTELASKEAVIMGLQDAGTASFSFAFITDEHWAENAKKSPALLNDIIKKCYVPLIVNGGDIVAGPSGATKAEIKEEAQKFCTLFDELTAKRLTCIGNHDDNSISNLFAQTLNENEQYNYYERYTEDYENEIVYGDIGNYYYFDDKKSKVRYIITDTNDVPYTDDGQGGLVYTPMTKGYYRQDQLTWFASKALVVPDDTWSVIVFSHYPVNQGVIVNDDLFMNVLKAFALKTSYTGTSSSEDPTFSASVSVDYTSAGGIVIGWFAGHQHEDKDINMGSYPFHCIVTLNDGTGTGKTPGTTTEQAFDVVTVNQSTKNVNMTRIGLGSNRSFNYSLS